MIFVIFKNIKCVQFYKLLIVMNVKKTPVDQINIPCEQGISFVKHKVPYQYNEYQCDNRL